MLPFSSTDESNMRVVLLLQNLFYRLHGRTIVPKRRQTLSHLRRQFPVVDRELVILYPAPLKLTLSTPSSTKRFVVVLFATTTSTTCILRWLRLSYWSSVSISTSTFTFPSTTTTCTTTLAIFYGGDLVFRPCSMTLIWSMNISFPYILPGSF